MPGSITTDDPKVARIIAALELTKAAGVNPNLSIEARAEQLGQSFATIFKAVEDSSLRGQG